MYSQFIVTNDNKWLQYKSFKFSGGEVSVKLTPEMTSFVPDLNQPFIIQAHLHNSDKIFELILLVDAIRREWPIAELALKCPYVPYARQDRVCATGESFSLKVFADIINSLRFNWVQVADVHSDVATKFINNLDNVHQWRFVQGIDSKYLINTVLVSPDKGALKKIDTVAKNLKMLRITAEKVRDPNTGAITHTAVDVPMVFKDNNLLVVDDICDGGRTFVELAKVLKPQCTGKLYLYVTHGIFSKGLDELKGYYDKIFTAYPFPDVDMNYVTKVIGE